LVSSWVVTPDRTRRPAAGGRGARCGSRRGRLFLAAGPRLGASSPHATNACAVLPHVALGHAAALRPVGRWVGDVVAEPSPCQGPRGERRFLRCDRVRELLHPTGLLPGGHLVVGCQTSAATQADPRCPPRPRPELISRRYSYRPTGKAQQESGFHRVSRHSYPHCMFDGTGRAEDYRPTTRRPAGRR